MHQQIFFSISLKNDFAKFISFKNNFAKLKLQYTYIFHENELMLISCCIHRILKRNLLKSLSGKGFQNISKDPFIFFSIFTFFLMDIEEGIKDLNSAISRKCDEVTLCKFVHFITTRKCYVNIFRIFPFNMNKFFPG